MARREYTENPLSGGVVSFQTGAAPAAPQIGGTDFTQIQRSLQAFTKQAEERRVAEGKRVAQERALRTQGELGAEELAEPDATWGDVYQQAFRAQASEVYKQNLLNDSDRVDTELRQKHRNDPQGYLDAKQAYVETTLTGLQERDVGLFEDAKLLLDKQTNDTYSRLSEVAFQNELEQNREQAKFNFQQAQTNAVQSLLEPDADRELIVEERRGDLYSQAARDLDLGLINEVEYQQQLAGIDDTLYFASVRGDVQDALEAGNFGVVEGYIDDLERGVGVTFALDNGRSLASEIRTDLRRVRSAGGGIARDLSARASTEASILLAGGDPGELSGSLRRYQEYAENSGDPELQAQARRAQADFNAATWVQDDLVTSGANQLEADINRFRNDPSLSNEFRTRVVEQGTERLREVRNAEGDPQALRDLFPTQNIEEVARIGDVDPSDVPTFSTRQMEETIPNAIESGNLYNTLFDPEQGLMRNSRLGGNDLAETLVRSDLSEDEKASALLAVKLFQNGATDLAAQSTNLAAMTSEQEANFASAFENTDEVATLIDALSYGDPRTRGTLQRGMAMIASGRLAELGETDVGAREYKEIAGQIVREMQSSIDLVEVGGRPYPAMDFALSGEGPEQARTRANTLGREIEAELEAQGKSSQGIRIRPTPSGGVEVGTNFSFDTRVMSPDGDAEWTFEEVAIEDDRRRINNARQRDRAAEERADPAWTEELQSRDPERYTSATLAEINSRLAEVSQASGVEQPLLRAVVAASDKLTSSTRASRDVPPEKDSIRMTDPRGVGNPIATRDMLPNIYVFEQGIEGGEFGISEQANWIKTTQGLFDNDASKVLAAYWGGRENVQSLVDEYGEDWLDAAPATMKNFVRSGIRFYENEDFQFVPKSRIGTLPDPSGFRGSPTFDPSRRGM